MYSAPMWDTFTALMLIADSRLADFGLADGNESRCTSCCAARFY